MKWVLCLLLLMFAGQAKAGMEELYQSTGKIMICDNKNCWWFGTGSVYKEDEEYYYVLTNYHVIDHGPHTLFVQFYYDKEIFTVKAERNDVSYFYDVASLKIKKKEFEGHVPPTIMPLADKDYKIEKGQKAMTCGCPDGNWPSLLVGTIEDVEVKRFDQFGRATGMSDFIMMPSPIKGRSGSPICDKEGKFTIGIYQLVDGTCIDVQTIRTVLNE